jgi:hypothetical protein
MTGFSRTTIASIENGGETDTSHLIEIAKAIGVSPAEIFNISFDLKPRHKLSVKRKDQQKLTQKIRALLDSGYFNQQRMVSDVKQELFESHKVKSNGVHISVILRRIVIDGKLKVSKKGRKHLYSSKGK